MRSAHCKLREASRCPTRQTLRCAQGDSGEADKSAPTIDFVYLHQRHFNMPKVYTTLITKSSKNVQSRGGKMGFSMANPMRTPFPLRDNLLQLFLLFNLVHLLHRNTLVPATIKSQHRRIDFRDIFRGWVVSACIEWHRGCQIGITGRDNKGHQSADTEAYEAQLFRFNIGH